MKSKKDYKSSVNLTFDKINYLKDFNGEHTMVILYGFRLPNNIYKDKMFYSYFTFKMDKIS